ncbi:MAG: hypothetical protein ACM3MK_09250 [Chitinophagales bacterium]
MTGLLLFCAIQNGVVGIALLSNNRWEAIVRTMGEKYLWMLHDPRTRYVHSRCMNPKLVNAAVAEFTSAVLLKLKQNICL